MRREQRDQAWAVFKYPCIGRMSFLDFSIGLSPQYSSVLEHLKTGDATLLDLGCCLAQDLRKLVYDGIPGTALYGSELEAGFIDLGYDLFRDRNTLQAKFSANDFFDEITPNEVLREGSFDYIYAASFFHLFGWEEQVQAFSRAVRLLKPRAGSLIFGRQTSTEGEAHVLNHHATRSGNMFRHNKESFRKLIEEVSTRVGIDLEIEMGDQVRPENDYAAGTDVRMMTFGVRHK